MTDVITFCSNPECVCVFTVCNMRTSDFRHLGTSRCRHVATSRDHQAIASVAKPSFYCTGVTSAIKSSQPFLSIYYQHTDTCI